MYKPHKVLVIASSYPIDEHDQYARWLSEFYKRLSSQGHQITVIAPWLEKRSSEHRDGIQIEWFPCYFRSTFNALRDRPLSMRYRNCVDVLHLLPFFLFSCLAIIRFKKAKSFDVVHVHNAFPDGPLGIFVRCIYGLPLIYLGHGDENRFGSSKIVKCYLKYFFESADILISNSSELAIAMKPYTERNWKLLPYVADAGSPKVDLDRSKALRVLVMVDPSDASGVATMVRGIPSIIEQQRVEFYFQGIEHYPNDFTDRYTTITLAPAPRLLRNSNTGEVSQVLANCDVCVVLGAEDTTDGSDWLKKATMQAYRFRKPVIATNVSNIEEFVIENVTGYIVPFGDSAALSDAIGNLLSHPYKCERFGNAGFDLRQDNSAWDLVMRDLEDLQCIAAGLSLRLPESTILRTSSRLAVSR